MHENSKTVFSEQFYENYSQSKEKAYQNDTKICSGSYFLE